MTEEMQRIALACRPEGPPGPQNSRLERTAIPEFGDGKNFGKTLVKVS